MNIQVMGMHGPRSLQGPRSRDGLAMLDAKPSRAGQAWHPRMPPKGMHGVLCRPTRGMPLFMYGPKKLCKCCIPRSYASAPSLTPNAWHARPAKTSPPRPDGTRRPRHRPLHALHARSGAPVRVRRRERPPRQAPLPPPGPARASGGSRRWRVRALVSAHAGPAPRPAGRYLRRASGIAGIPATGRHDTHKADSNINVSSCVTTRTRPPCATRRRGGRA